MTTAYRSGGVTVTLSGDLAAWAERATIAATNGAVTTLQAAMQAVADKAEADWYSANGVQRVTGLSGQMAVVTTIDDGRGVITVSVGSADTRSAGKKGARVPNFVHRPGALASRLQVVTHAEFFAAPKSTRVGRSKIARPGVVVGDYLIRVHSEKASDGKMLLPVFVNAPGKAALKAVVPDIARMMKTRIEVTRAN